MSFVLGLTGKYCAGKNLASGFLEDEGFLVLDADSMGHAALEEGKLRIAERFGAGLVRDDGTLDRKELGRRVFGKPKELEALEAIVHPKVIARIEAEIISGKAPRICINAALLYRTDLAERCDLILEIRAPLLSRMLRAKARDGAGLGQFILRIQRQRNLRPGKSLAKKNIRIITNSGAPGDLRLRIQKAVFDKLPP